MIHELPPPNDQFPQLLLLLAEPLRRGVRGLPEPGDDPGVDLIRLRQEADGLGAVPHLARVHDGDVMTGGHHLRDEFPLVPARRFGDECPACRKATLRFAITGLWD